MQTNTPLGIGYRPTNGFYTTDHALIAAQLPRSTTTVVYRGPGRALPNDRGRLFTAAARQALSGALVKCEERFPATGHHSVLYVVVDAEAASGSVQRVQALHHDFFGPGADDTLEPVRLQVVDRRTDDAIQHQLESGLLSLTTRAVRVLWPQPGADSAIALSLSEQKKVAALREEASHKLKVAGVLLNADLSHDARRPLLEAMLAFARSMAVEERLPQPELVHESLLPPYSGCWQDTLPMMRQFATEPGMSCATVLETLQKLLREA